MDVCVLRVLLFMVTVALNIKENKPKGSNISLYLIIKRQK